MDASLRDELKAEVDDLWSETIRHLPLAKGAPDTTRSPAEFAAILRTGARDEERPNYAGTSGRRVGVMADGGVLRIDRSAWPDVLPRKGDKVVALDREGQPVFDVLAVDDRSHLRLICDLGEAN
ncbi:hypothetical protein KM176_05590 [Pseudooceanicola sp. CBS1P-1]|uniref:Uncharacterized protein n=1 Tax=Pseudooceanicola albus TaxID=2692189 RepID=A0A6L7FY50_9RHOB|nr:MULTISPECIES: hypothetical protein [Pseudooceanicola]MBT9383325.1 hypothetical protein [Pseudooceanicola endophyticus]MXN16352.1 hypothetical protein [Pseudooceanicola albus]